MARETMFCLQMLAGLLLLCCAGTLAQRKVVNMTRMIPAVTTFTSPERFHRYMVIMEDHIFIAARNKLYIQKVSNISEKFAEPMVVKNRTVLKDIDYVLTNFTYGSECYDQRWVSDEEKEFQCHNYVTNIWKRDNGNLLMCSTNALVPFWMEYKFNKTTGEMEELDGPHDAYFRLHERCSKLPLPTEETHCKFIPINATGRFPGVTELEYCTRRDLSRDVGFRRRPILQYKPLTTPPEYRLVGHGQHMGNWLRNGILDYKDYTMAFFEEDDTVTRQIRWDQKRIQYIYRYPKVLQVCKIDIGFHHNLNSGFTRYFSSLMKAKLSCIAQGPGDIELHRMFDLQRIGDDVYILFSTFPDPLIGETSIAGICRYNLAKISATLKTEMRNKTDPTKTIPFSAKPVDYTWERYPDRSDCSLNSTLWGNNPFRFLSEQSEVMKIVESDEKVALYSGGSYVYIKMVMAIEGNVTFFYMATDDGEIHKAMSYMDGGKNPYIVRDDRIRSRLLARWTPFTDAGFNSQIWHLELKNDYIYASTDDKVIQLSTKQCEKYTICNLCVLDPHCGWDFTETSCKENATDLIQDYKSGDYGAVTCNTKNLKPPTEEVRTTTGAASFFHLKSPEVVWCSLNNFTAWTYQGERIYTSGVRYHRTSQLDLIVTEVRPEDGGIYEFVCLEPEESRIVTLKRYNVTVSECSFSTASEYQVQYKKWCEAFSEYKEQMDDWKKRYADNQCTSTP